MSDCTNGGRRAYNAPTHTPAEDRLETVLHFKGEFNPHPIVLNRLDREVDYVTVDGERYERVSEREIANDGEYVYKRERIANGVYTAESTGEQIVRCRDCEHYYEAEEYHPNGNYDRRCCKYFDTYNDEVEPDGFCAWGELKEGGDD